MCAFTRLPNTITLQHVHFSLTAPCPDGSQLRIAALAWGLDRWCVMSHFHRDTDLALYHAENDMTATSLRASVSPTKTTIGNGNAGQDEEDVLASLRRRMAGRKS